METIAKQLTQRLVLSGKIRESKEDIIRYGFEIIISTSLVLLSILSISAVMFNRYDGIIFIQFFVLVRLFSGGKHASNYHRCYICSMTIFCAVVVSSVFFAINSILIKLIIMLLCYLYIFSETPKDDGKHQIAEIKVLMCKSKIKKVLLINMLFFAVLCLVGEHYSSLATYTTVMVAVLIGIVK